VVDVAVDVAVGSSESTAISSIEKSIAPVTELHDPSSFVVGYPVTFDESPYA